MAMGSTQYCLWGKGGRCVGLTNHLHVPTVLKSWNLSTAWNPHGLPKPTQGWIYLYRVNWNCPFGEMSWTQHRPLRGTGSLQM